MKEWKSSATHIRALSLLLLIGALSKVSLAAPGGLDLSFDPGSGVNGPVNAIVLQPDGKLLIGGSFTARIARLNGDGSPDTTFNGGTNLPGSYVQEIALQSDGKVLVMVDNFSIFRLKADGTSDSQFHADIGDHFAPQDYTTVLAFALQPDGKMLVAGYTDYFYVDPDCPYYPNCYTYVSTLFFVKRLHSNGSRDTSFGAGLDGAVYAIALQPDGKVLIGGSFSAVNGTNRNAVARLNANGTLDSSFNPGDGVDGPVESIALQTDGKVLIGGAFSTVDGANRSRIARLNAGGSLDGSFDPGTGANGLVSVIALQPDGRILSGGGFTAFNGVNRGGIVLLNASGSLDSSFNGSVAPTNASVESLALQADGKVFIGGTFTTLNGVFRPFVARLYGDASAMSVLSIARSNNVAVLSWPVSFGNFQLQENTNLSLANGWSALAGTRSTNNNSISVAFPATGSRKFFRLNSP